MEEWNTGNYYVPEKLHYSQNIQFTMGNDDLSNLLSIILTRVPRKIVDKVLNNCLYLMPRTKEKGCYFPNRVLKGKHIILFPDSLLKQSSKGQIHTILHETAHYILKHKSPLEFPYTPDNTDLEEYNRQEQEADNLVKKWLKDWEKSKRKETKHKSI